MYISNNANMVQLTMTLQETKEMIKAFDYALKNGITLNGWKVVADARAFLLSGVDSAETLILNSHWLP